MTGKNAKYFTSLIGMSLMATSMISACGFELAKQDKHQFGLDKVDFDVVSGSVNSVSENDESFLRFEKGKMVAKVDSPVVGKDAFTIAIRFRAPSPNENYKLVSQAKWSGGCDAKGFNIGTHYPETWGENSSQCMIYQQSTCEGSRWGGSFEPNRWYHLAISVSPDGDYKEYVNGEIVYRCRSTGERLGDPSSKAVGLGQDELVLGSWGGGFGFTGDLKDLYMIDRQLSDDEILAIAAE